jgi:UDPglucose 6-dehydrogenase
VGTTDSLNDKYKNVVYVPEFVTEATARIDARYPDKVVIGCGNEHKDELLKLHRPLEAPMMITTRSEAEMIKLVINSFYATKVEFANEVYDACSECGADYTVVRRAMELDQRIFPHHLDVMHGGYRGFGGKCLPKDIGILTGAFYMPVLQEVRRVNDLRRDGDL